MNKLFIWGIIASFLCVSCEELKENTDDELACITLKEVSCVKRGIEFGENYIGKKRYWKLYNQVRDSISNWQFSRNDGQFADLSGFRFSGIDSLLRFNGAKNRVNCFVYYGLKIPPDSLKNYLKQVASYEKRLKAGVIETTEYYGDKVYSEPPPFLHDFSFLIYEIEFTGTEINLLNILDGGQCGVNIKPETERQVIKRMHDLEYLSKKGDCFILSDYYQNQK